MDDHFVLKLVVIFFVQLISRHEVSGLLNHLCLNHFRFTRQELHFADDRLLPNSSFVSG